MCKRRRVDVLVLVVHSALFAERLGGRLLFLLTSGRDFNNALAQPSSEHLVELHYAEDIGHWAGAQRPYESCSLRRWKARSSWNQRYRWF